MEHGGAYTSRFPSPYTAFWSNGFFFRLFQLNLLYTRALVCTVQLSERLIIIYRVTIFFVSSTNRRIVVAKQCVFVVDTTVRWPFKSYIRPSTSSRSQPFSLFLSASRIIQRRSSFPARYSLSDASRFTKTRSVSRYEYDPSVFDGRSDSGDHVG